MVHDLADRVRMDLKKQKVFTLKVLQAHLDCSPSTAKRHIKRWGTFTSFNLNGRYYCLPEVPRFDRYGIWRCQGAYFSKHGNLKQTVRALIDHAEAGLSAPELTEIMGIPAYQYLSHFKNETWIKRQKFKGLYVYFSSDDTASIRQKHKRMQLFARKAADNLPSDAEAVTILVTWIKHPSDDVKTLTQRVQRSGLKLTQQQVENLLDYHDLLKKR